ncbi:hypothetical protein ACFQJD_18180 [Haloplanus sp. GCM10025708]
MANTNTVPFWWIVLFLLLALGAGAYAVQAVGGSLVAGAVLLPLH